jgi:hypothetical protein
VVNNKWLVVVVVVVKITVVVGFIGDYYGIAALALAGY